MPNFWGWLTDKNTQYDKRFIFQVLSRFAILFIVFNILYLFIQPLNNTDLTLFNRIVPGRLRLAWTDANTTYVNEVRIPRLIGDHIVARPKAPDEYRIVVLGSSETWGYFNRPQDTMPVVMDSQQIIAPDGRKVRVYNLAYVYADIFKDMMIEDFILNEKYRPDLIILMTNTYSFDPLLRIHWLTSANPDIARDLVRKYNLSIPIGVPQDANLVQNILERNFVGNKGDIASWLMNQVAGLNRIWYPDLDDYPWEPSVTRQSTRGQLTGWTNKRPDVLNAFVDIARMKHVPVLLVDSPQNYSVTDYLSWLADQAREQEIPLLDCSGSLPPAEFTNTNLHLTPNGQRFVAEQTIDLLRRWWSDPTLHNAIVTQCPPEVE